jgi:hypothetical protein
MISLVIMHFAVTGAVGRRMRLERVSFIFNTQDEGL